MIDENGMIFAHNIVCVKKLEWLMEMQKTNILLCESNESFGLLLSEFLTSKGYMVDFTEDGDSAWQKFNRGGHDICIFNTELTQRSGLQLVQDIRDVGSDIPIIFYTEQGAPADILAGYKAGADDYVVRPCQMEIMMYKIESFMRRIGLRQASQPTEFQLGKLHFDAVRQLLQTDNETIHLSSRESDVLMYLALNITKVVDRSFLLKTIWKNDSYFTTRSLSVYINHLRKILQVDPTIQILNIHGKGYRLVVSNV